MRDEEMDVKVAQDEIARLFKEEPVKLLEMLYAYMNEQLDRFRSGIDDEAKMVAIDTINKHRHQPDGTVMVPLSSGHGNRKNPIHGICGASQQKAQSLAHLFHAATRSYPTTGPCDCEQAMPERG